MIMKQIARILEPGTYAEAGFIAYQEMEMLMEIAVFIAGRDLLAGDEKRITRHHVTGETNTYVVFSDGRLAQLLSNLLANALTHGSPVGVIYVHAFHKEGLFELSVRNSGQPIAAGAMAKLFHPFAREGNRPSQNGLGLGLYIDSQIALAHQGELSVASDDHETRFIFRMPPVQLSK